MHVAFFITYVNYLVLKSQYCNFFLFRQFKNICNSSFLKCRCIGIDIEMCCKRSFSGRIP